MNNKIKKYFHELGIFHTAPSSMAFGFAIGTFVSILPTLGFGAPICLAIVFLFPKISKVSLFGGLFFWNPFFAAPFYMLSYEFGKLIFTNIPTITFKISLLNKLYELSGKYLIGNIIIATIVSAISYSIIYTMVHYLKTKYPIDEIKIHLPRKMKKIK